jgi:superfamily II DNA or RNA helicase
MPTVPRSPTPPVADAQEGSIVEALAASVQIEPRDYQKQVVARVIAMFSGPHAERHVELPEARSVMVESPTGSGKTVMGLLVAKWAQERMGMRVVWSAMRRYLLRQVERENRERGFGVDLVTVSMFDKRPPQGDLLIVDEAQHDATRSMASLHATVGAKKVLGLSATPWRADRLGLCFERVVRDAGIRQLVLDGYLSPFAHHTISRYTPESVATTWLREPDRWGRTLVFFRTIAECRACAALLEAVGVSCEVVTGSSDREAQIKRFEAGSCRVILGVAVLAEGFDCPQLQTVFCRPSVKGPTVQMAGRVLRKGSGIPLKSIVQCAATKHPFPATATPAVQYVETDDGWRSIGLNDRVERASARMLNLLVRMSKRDREEKHDGDSDDQEGHRTRRGLRRIAPWNYRAAEARDHLERRRRRSGR